MKHFYSYLVIVYFFVLNGFSQTKTEIEFIKNNSNISKLQTLKSDFENQDIINDTEINTFILNNPTYKKEFIYNGKKYQILKIIDNKPVYLTTDNALAAIATRASKLHTGGSTNLNLNGENMLLAVWDGGKARTTHQEFMNQDSPAVSRVTSPDNPLAIAPTNDHATHVSGTLVAQGVNINAKGMAPKANLLSYDWNNDENEVVTAITNNGILLSNHSYGVPVMDDNNQLNVPTWVMGCYSSECVNWDEIAYNAPYYLCVMSAGNSGMDSYTGGSANGYDKLTYEKNAKNLLIVANADPSVNTTTGVINSVVINPSSSQGPSDDGRIKPDISGDGTNLFSTLNTNNTSYTTYSGTSMASPNVTGTLILLQQYYKQLNPNYMRSATLKGLAIHTAKDAGSTGPDPKFGYGLLDAEAAANVITSSKLTTPTSIINELVLQNNQVYTFDVIVNNPQKLMATICWTDIPGASQSNQHNSTTPALVNNLDLRIKKGNDETMPWKLNFPSFLMNSSKQDNNVDNVEKVEVDNASGTYTIQVSHKGTLSGGSQSYSLVISGFDQVVLNEKDNLSTQFKIYPNPVSNFINYEIPTNIIIDSIEVYDISGKKINITINPNKTIDASNLQKGLYFIKFTSDNIEVTKKFIKQ